jgi:hypothetical protein
VNQSVHSHTNKVQLTTAWSCYTSYVDVCVCVCGYFDNFVGVLVICLLVFNVFLNFCNVFVLFGSCTFILICY